ncbi:MAG: hypothetical protein E7508_06455 [Ruminococcus sp.]|nr:hypothetical protein [Ruminococcus sp.]
MKFKKILTVLLSVSMLACLSACDSEDSSSSKKEEVATETVATEEQAAEEETEEAAAEDEAAAEESEAADAAAIAEDAMADFDPENPEEAVLSILESGFASSFGENMEVTYDEAETNYTISVWQDGFAAALDTEAGASTLNTMSDSLTSALQTMTEQIRALDEDANITFNFLSDVDQSEILLTIYNGEMTYNAAE